MPPLQFIYFDAAWTLIHPRQPVGYQYAQIASRYGINADPDRLKDAFPKAWKDGKKTHSIEPNVPYGRTLEESLRFWSEVVRQCFLRAEGEAPDSPSFYEELFLHFATANAWELEKTALEAINHLKNRGVGIGVLSNFDSRLPLVLEALGIRKHFDAIIFSAEVGDEKPSPAIYAAAEKACGHSGNEVGMIGDDKVHDGHGPQQCGWKVCQLKGSEEDSPDLPSRERLIDCVKFLVSSHVAPD